MRDASALADCPRRLTADAVACDGDAAMDADIKAAFDQINATLAKILSTQSQHITTLAQHTASLAAITSTTRSTLEQVLFMATNLDIANAAIAALADATSQEAALLQTTSQAVTGIATSVDTATATLAAQGPKLDAIQQRINQLIAAGDVPQATLDALASLQTQVAGVQTTITGVNTALSPLSASAAALSDGLTQQSARLDQMGTNPSNPVPLKPPASA